jgi:hypothetical protein
MLWERNVAINSSMQGVGTDIIMRNNTSHNGNITITDEARFGETSDRAYSVNNTSYYTGAAGPGVSCNIIGTCVMKNNLSSSTGTLDSCMSGASGGGNKNWCYSSNICLDPVDDGTSEPGDCFDPNFVSTTIGNPSFLRPATGTRGLNIGYQVAPVDGMIFDDYFGAPRNDGNLDIGAVER